MKFDTPNFNRPWKIAIEEHFAIEDTMGDSAAYATGGQEAWRKLSSNLSDLTKQRIEQMDATGIELSILSLNSPAIQGIYDKGRAVQAARRSNDVVANAIAKHSDRFRSFAAVPMQDPDEAIKELIRCVKELGFVGALINGFSQIGEEDTSYYLDIPKYRPFWAEVEKLDVPVYLHPREPLSSQQRAYKGHPWLLGAAWAFGVETAAPQYEYWIDQVQLNYLTLLGRQADAAGLTSNVNFLVAGGTIEQMQANLLGSPEYFTSQGGGTNQGFLTALYQDLLNRSVDAAAQALYGGALNAGVSRTQVATTRRLYDLLQKGFAFPLCQHIQ